MMSVRALLTPITSALALLLALLFLTTGCATIRPDVHVVHFGQSDLLKDQAVSEATSEVSVDEPLPEIKVFYGEMPQGLALEEGGAKLVILEGFADAYRVIGSVEGDYISASQWAGMRNMFWTWDYEDSWRKALCYPQVPLKIITFGIWSYMIPLHYPCFASVPNDEAKRRMALQSEMMRAAEVMGGDLIVIIGSSSTFAITGNNGVVTSQTIGMTGLKGFVVEELR